MREHNVPIEELVRGLSFPVQHLLRPSNRITWDEFIVVLENAVQAVGGADRFENFCASYYERAGGLLGALAARVSSARPLYHMAARWYGPSLFTCTIARCEDLPDGRIRQTVEILPGFRPSTLYFQTMRAAMRGIPALIGQPQAQVEMDVDGRHAVYIITPPPTLNLWGRARRAFTWYRKLESADEELTVQRDELRKGYEMARRAGELLTFQTRRLEHEQEQRAHAEQLMLQAQKLETIGRLAGGIAHDFNNILTTIVGYTDVALDRLDRNDPLHADLDEVRALSERGSELVKQLLSVSRPQPLATRRILLNEVVLALEPMLRRLLPASIQVAVLPASGPLEVIADPGQIEQVLLNLAVNARDAMPSGGRLEIELRRASAVEAGAGARPGASYARLEVRDTGQGMDAETVARAFEPFFTTKAAGKGSGLGLASVHSIVSRAGGTVRLESELAKGTAVILHLPLAISSEAPEG
jgi:signal transduction histidine kinase